MDDSNGSRVKGPLKSWFGGPHVVKHDAGYTFTSGGHFRNIKRRTFWDSKAMLACLLARESFGYRSLQLSLPIRAG